MANRGYWKKKPEFLRGEKRCDRSCREGGRSPPGGGDAELVALLVLDAAARLDALAARRAVLALLPPYMAPTRFRRVAGLPRSRLTHKLLRNALPCAFDDCDDCEHSSRDESGTTDDDALRAIWRAVLPLAGASGDARATFFELGGDSVKAIALSRQIRDELGVRLSPVEARATRRTFKRPRGVVAVVVVVVVGC